MLPPGTRIYKKQTFLSWLFEQYGETPRHLYELCLVTGRASDYYKMMEWYQRRYRKIQKTRELLEAQNPFNENMEENENGYSGNEK